MVVQVTQVSSSPLEVADDDDDSVVVSLSLSLSCESSSMASSRATPTDTPLSMGVPRSCEVMEAMDILVGRLLITRGAVEAKRAGCIDCCVCGCVCCTG